MKARVRIGPAVLVLLACTGATAHAQQGTTIHGCVNDVRGTVRIVEPPAPCAPSEHAVQWSVEGPPGPQGPAGPAGPIGPPGPAADLTLSCAGDVATVHTCNGDSCVDQRYPCSPFTCDADGRTCIASCTTNNDCGTGAACNDSTGQCTFVGNVCKDSFIIRSAAGKETSCAPYLCLAGQCREQCGGDSECAEGYTCNVDTGRCRRP